MKTKHCKHTSENCNLNAVKGFTQSFKWTFIFRYILEKLFKLFMLFKKKKGNVFELLFGIKENADIVRFAAIIGLVTASYKFFLCVLRRVIKREQPDKIAAPIAGALSSLWLSLDSSPARR